MEERRRNTDSQIDVLTERVENWMETTTEYRKALCSKLDKINDRLNELPCKSRIEHTKGIDQHIKALWACVSAIFLAIIAEWVRTK